MAQESPAPMSNELLYLKDSIYFYYFAGIRAIGSMGKLFGLCTGSHMQWSGGISM